MEHQIKPKLIVFDLDFTLWPFWVDTHVTPPFKKHFLNSKIHDHSGRQIDCYDGVPAMLKQLKSEGYILAIASRTSMPDAAKSLVKLFKWDHYFSYSEIYPGSKLSHFKQFHKNSGIAFKDMLFFDDESRNIVEVGTLGVTCILADKGMTQHILSEGFQRFEMNNS